MSKPECTCQIKIVPDSVQQPDDDSLRFDMKLVKCPLCEAAPDLLAGAKGLIAQVEKSGGMAMEAPRYKAKFDALKTAIKKAEAQS